ncbi:hypothetical protein EVAR_53031_1 [Eumeta japonica]|uniref:Uncharacterized protein n=1 Tax=Eumeta variegata TaxID=151549 RepID=A0A4C1XNE8_EUMVA|nr:hypothetical protein EVAR_53031_1 [Eumeta japonica]
MPTTRLLLCYSSTGAFNWFCIRAIDSATVVRYRIGFILDSDPAPALVVPVKWRFGLAAAGGVPHPSKLLLRAGRPDHGARRLAPELTYHNGKKNILTIFGYVGITLKCILTTIDFQGLMMEFPNFELRYQTLKANRGQSVFHENTNKSKHG